MTHLQLPTSLPFTPNLPQHALFLHLFLQHLQSLQPRISIHLSPNVLIGSRASDKLPLCEIPAGHSLHIRLTVNGNGLARLQEGKELGFVGVLADFED